jgi:hypothetical protein
MMKGTQTQCSYNLTYLTVRSLSPRGSSRVQSDG